MQFDPVAVKHRAQADPINERRGDIAEQGQSLRRIVDARAGEQRNQAAPINRLNLRICRVSPGRWEQASFVRSIDDEACCQEGMKIF
jgi:hypothetical protein